MNCSLLLENQKKRLQMPLSHLICFAMFSTWQMGFIYFMGPSLTIDGKTPLPIDMDNITTLIALAYVFSILFMIFFPRFVVWAERISTITALVSVVGLFLPLSADILRFLIYLQVFCCCFMIGFETFIMVNLFSEKCAILHMTVAYALAVFLTAFAQNDFARITYPGFRFVTIIMLLMMLYFFFRLPTEKEAIPTYVKKEDHILRPGKLFVGIYSLVFVGALMGVSGPGAVSNFTHGVFTLYLADALGSLILYILYKKAGIHPLHTISLFIALSVIGYLFMFTAEYIPAPDCTGIAGMRTYRAWHDSLPVIASIRRGPDENLSVPLYPGMYYRHCTGYGSDSKYPGRSLPFCTEYVTSGISFHNGNTGIYLFAAGAIFNLCH